MNPKVYLETTIPSYLTAWPSRDLVRAAHQQLTWEWWDSRRLEFDLYISPIVLRECAAGDSIAAQERLKVIPDLPLLDLSDEATVLAEQIVDGVPLPPKASFDALHIAIAAASGMDYLLTWNCRHIANAAFRVAMTRIINSAGFQPALICTPEELLGSELDEFRPAP